MRKIWLVTQHEIKTTLAKPSFWITAFLLPAVLIGFNLFSFAQQDELIGNGNDPASDETAGAPSIGLVDEGGLITHLPDGVPADVFIFYKNVETARSALEAGTVAQVVYLPADYIAGGKIKVYAQNFQILGANNDGVGFDGTADAMFRQMLNANLIGNEQTARIFDNPTPGWLAEKHDITPSKEAPGEIFEENQAMARTVASVIPYVFYFVMVISSGLMLQSVSAEKENLTVEVLLLSLHPRQLMFGKILGLSALALLELIIWLGGGMFFFNRGSSLFNLSGFTFPPGFVVWAVLFFAFGFLLYASIMTAAGALAPTAREGGRIIILLIIPLMPTLMFGSEFFENPHGAIAMVLSLFPFSAPSAMVARLAVAEVPIWQPLLSLGGLIACTYVAVVLAGRFFRADNLLSAASFSWRRLMPGRR